MKTTALLATLLPLIGACSSTVPATSLGQALNCHALPGTRQILETHPQTYLIFGEQHGTQEAPRAFAEIACEASLQGPIIVGIERPMRDQAAMQNFIDSTGTGMDQASLVTTVFDGNGWGSSSEAMLALLKRLQMLRQAGADIQISAFKNDIMGPTQDQGPYELGLAESLIRAHGNTPEARVLVLVGNVHARLTEFAANDGWPGFAPMATHLPSDQRLTFDLHYSGGTAFNCTKQGCSEHPVFARPISSDPELTLNNPFPNYDGIWFVGEVSASPPIGGQEDRGDVE